MNGQKIQVLIAEDSHSDIELIKMQLNSAQRKGLLTNIQLTIVESVDDLIAAVKKETFDVIFLDHDLKLGGTIEISTIDKILSGGKIKVNNILSTTGNDDFAEKLSKIGIHHVDKTSIIQTLKSLENGIAA